MLLRDLGDGTSEVTTLSWWIDMAAIRAFAGEDVEIARYYPEDAGAGRASSRRRREHALILDSPQGRPVRALCDSHQIGCDTVQIG